MKKLILALVMVLGAAAQAEDIALISRYNIGNYHTATYSFRKMTADVNLTRNNWDVLFEARADFNDFFEGDTVTDDRSSIYDLGPVCKDAISKISANEVGPSRANVIEGNCYLLIVRDSDGTATVLFKVKKHVKSLMVVLSDIIVLNKTVTNRQ